MLQKEEIQVKTVTAAMENEHVMVRIKVDNPLDRTLYAYANPRRVLYDNATGKLTLCLHDRDLPEDPGYIRDIGRPHIMPLEGKTETEIKLELPPVVHRLRTAAERAGGTLTEDLRIGEATEILVEVAHQDTPFYYDPKKSSARQFKEWGSNVARGSFKIPPLSPKADEPPAPKPKPKRTR